MLALAQSRTLCSCKMGIDPLGDHVLTCKQRTGSIRGHNHLMDVVARLSRDSKIGPVRFNHKVSTTGDGTRKQGDTEISNFPISLSVGLSLTFPLCVSSRVAAVNLGGGIRVCAILMTSYRPVPMSRTTNTRTSMVSGAWPLPKLIFNIYPLTNEPASPWEETFNWNLRDYQQELTLPPEAV